MLRRISTLRGAEQTENVVRGGDAGRDQLARAREVAQVSHTDPTPAVLVLVRGTDTPPRRPDFLLLLVGAIEQLVTRQREMRAIRDVDFLIELDATLRELIELCEERF